MKNFKVFLLLSSILLFSASAAFAAQDVPIAWDPGAGAEKYEIRLSLDGSIYSKVGETTQTSYLLTGLADTTLHYVRVYSVAGQTYSSQAAQLLFGTAPWTFQVNFGTQTGAYQAGPHYLSARQDFLESDPDKFPILFSRSGVSASSNGLASIAVSTTALPIPMQLFHNINGFLAEITEVDIRNVTTLATNLAGDVNGTNNVGDNRVNTTDLATLISYWGATQDRSDLNDDGTVNANDLAVLLGNWNKTGPVE